MTFGYIFKAYIRITMIVIRNKSSKFVLVDLKPSCFHVIIVSWIFLAYEITIIMIPNKLWIKNSFIKHVF